MSSKNKSSFLNRQTASLADDVSLYFLMVEEIFRRHNVLSNVDRLAAGECGFEIAEANPPTDALEPNHMMLLAEAAAVHRRWFTKDGRVAFSFHPDMVLNLMGGTSSKIPGDVFSHMTHTSPLVLFTRSVPTTRQLTGEPAQLRGFFVFGVKDRREDGGWAICETDDDAATEIGMMMIIAPSKDVEDLEFDRVMIPVGQTFTVKDAVERTMDSYSITDDHELIDATAYRERTLNALTLALNVLFYICDDEQDHVPMTVVEPTGRRQQRKTSEPSPTRFIASGWTDGPALERSHRENRRALRSGRKSGGEQPYHRRRGHFRIVLTGVGRTIERLRWIKPYAVREDKKADAAARVIEVKPD